MEAATGLEPATQPRFVVWGSFQLSYAALKNGAGKRSRTAGLRITSAPLYRLSYSGVDNGRGDWI